MPDTEQTYYSYNDNTSDRPSAAADELEQEEMLLRKMNAELMTGMQVLMNMLIYMSQGGNFTRSGMDNYKYGKFTDKTPPWL